MAKSIGQMQASNMRFLDGVTEDISQYSDKTILEGLEILMGEYAAALVEQIGIQINKPRADGKAINASGYLLTNTKPNLYDDGKGFEITMPDYYDFVNKGVKGVKSSRNAPNSPYKYKNYGMSLEGRQSIRKYIESGRAKIKTVQKDKALGIGQESKGVSLIDAKVNTLVYLIKKYGIKKTNYFDDAIKIVMKDFNKQIAQTMGRTISIEITR